MVSCYNPVAMFGRGGTGHPHHHPHHTTPGQNPYFGGTYPAPGYHHPYAHSHHHQGGTQGGAGVVTSTQFSPNAPPEFNHAYQHQLGNMTPETMAAVGWHQPNVMYSACASGRNLSGYDDWTHHSHAYHPPSFYHHQQLTSPTSTPSPNSTNHGGHNSPSASAYSSHPIIFKTEFGSCSNGNAQESHEMQSSQGSSSSGGSLVSSASSSLIPAPTPHSPDSGMAISDGVSSSGSPATGNNSMCPTNHIHQHHHLSSTTMNPSSSNSMLQQSTQPHQSHLHNVHHSSLNSTINRPTQARSPYEWMRKPSNSHVSSNSNGGKTRTKDKYRVVYSDTQRVELEKEFHFARYITINRKSELARILGLSERQVKIWFQNRRAKDRKTERKRDEMIGRDKIAHIVHLQNAAVLSGNMHPGNPMCNHGNPLM